MSDAPSAYTIRLNEEKKRQSEIQAKLKAEEERKQAEQQRLQAAQSKDHKIDKDAQKLKKEKEETERELQVAKNLQKNAHNQMQIALKSGNIIAIQAAQKLSEQATAQLETVIEKQKTQLQKCVAIGEKRKKTLSEFFAAKKKN